MAEDLAVVHLLRRGNPETYAARFAASLAAHDAGAAHDLVVILKGFGPQDSPPRGAFPGARFIEIGDEGYDINAYRHAAEKLPHARLCFLNSHAEILASGWLGTLARALDRPGCGIAGASGSWEPLDEATPAPNVHIRTNGFLIWREDFLAAGFGPLATKRDCNRFEAGPDGLTRQVIARGLIPLVGLRGGQPSPPEDWPGCGGFRSGNQERLLIADNRTRDYQNASLRKRRRLARLAFQDAAAPRARPAGERLRAIFGSR